MQLKFPTEDKMGEGEAGIFISKETAFTKGKLGNWKINFTHHNSMLFKIS